jgi:hypothetical protein
MFSRTTIASSTTRPIASTSASRVRVLMVKPSTSISAKAPISDTGMVTSGISVARKLRRKKKMISRTSSIASPMVLKTASIERSMKTDES